MGLNQTMEMVLTPKSATTTNKLRNKTLANNSDVRKEIWTNMVENDPNLMNCKFIARFLFVFVAMLKGCVSNKVHESNY
jgi:hypothetical protein